MNCEAIALITNAIPILIGIENDIRHARRTHPSKHGYRKRYPAVKGEKTQIAALRSHGYRKRYPAHKWNTPTQTQVSKTIPGTQEKRIPHKHGYRKRYPARKRSALHANTGIENDTQHTGGAHSTQTQVSKTIPITQVEHTHANTGIENDTHHARRTHPRKRRYRKRYPTLKKNAPTQTRVSKTIPDTQEERAHASTGIENDTHLTSGTHPRKHGYRKRYPAVESIRSIGNLMKLGRIAYR